MNRRSKFRARTPLAFALSVLMAGFLPLVALAAGDESAHAQRLQPVKVLTKTGDQTFMVEIANTPGQRAQGLMFRTQISDRQGMLFDFGEEKEVRMWMKNTPISLDIIFIQRDGRIHRVVHNTEPESLGLISSHGPVRAVLEVKAGTSKKYGIAPGGRVVNQVFAD